MIPRDRLASAAMAAGAVALLFAVGPCYPSRVPTTTTTGADVVDRLVAPPAEPTMAVTPGTLPRATVKIAPARLRLPTLDVQAEVAPVGVTESGELEVPPDVDRVGWYHHGPGLEAAAGSVVVAGHVDGAGQGPGAFFRLGEIGPGDPVIVTGDDGVERRYRVVARERFDKASIPLDRYFARTGRPRLTLITCGGPFDGGSRHYRDNVVVTAVPMER